MPSDRDTESLVRRVKATLEELDDLWKETLRPLPKLRPVRKPRNARNHPPTLAETLEIGSPQLTKPRRDLVSEPEDLSEELSMGMLRPPPYIRFGRKMQDARGHPLEVAEAPDLTATQYTKPRRRIVSRSKELLEDRQNDIRQPHPKLRVGTTTKVAQVHQLTAAEAIKLTLQSTAFHSHSVLTAENLLEELEKECSKMQLRTRIMRKDIFGELAKENQKEKSTLAIGRTLHSKLPVIKSEEAKQGGDGDESDECAPDGDWEVLNKGEADDEWTLV